MIKKPKERNSTKSNQTTMLITMEHKQHSCTANEAGLVSSSTIKTRYLCVVHNLKHSLHIFTLFNGVKICVLD